MSDNNKKGSAKMSHDEIKIRKYWGMNPATKVHSTPKGKKGYERKESKREFREQWEEYEEDQRGDE